MSRLDKHSVRFPDDLWGSMNKIAELQGRSVSNWVHLVIKEALKNHEIEMMTGGKVTTILVGGKK